MKILAKNIHQFLDMHQNMNPKQRGFRSCKSCLFQLLEHRNKILKELEKSHSVGVIYIHFSKVFDKVERSILLIGIGINGKVGMWIHNLL